MDPCRYDAGGLLALLALLVLALAAGDDEVVEVVVEKDWGMSLLVRRSWRRLYNAEMNQITLVC